MIVAGNQPTSTASSISVVEGDGDRCDHDYGYAHHADPLQAKKQ